MNNLSRIGAQGFLHYEAQLGEVKLVSRVGMLLVTGVLTLFAGGHCAMGASPAAVDSSQEIAAAKAKKEATRRDKLQALIAEQMKLGVEAAGKKEWRVAARASRKVLKVAPDHTAAQELKRRASWGPLSEKTSGNLKYKVHPIYQACAITGVIDRDKVASLILPGKIEGQPLIRIGHKAFSLCQGLKSVTIPSSVTSIGDKAFYRCSGLRAVTIPTNVTSIGEQAFMGIGLTSVMIPSSVTRIGDRAFDQCWKLANLSVEAGNPSYQDAGGVLFTKGGKTLVQYPKRRPGYTYTIPSSVTSIGDRAFDSCEDLAFVTIPSSVTRIGDSAFNCCTALKSVTISSGVTHIGKNAFWSSGLTSVTIPSSVTSIGDGAFDRCGKLAILSVAAGNLSYQAAGGVLFTKGGKMLVQYPAGKLGRTYTIPSSVTIIGEKAFSYCKGLTSVTIPTSVTRIGKGAFYGCPALTSVTIPSGVTSIGPGAFENCKTLANISVAAGNSSYQTAGGVLFTKGGKILVQYPREKSGGYTIPSSVTSIGERAFARCSGLKSVTIPSGVTSIGDGAFNGCRGLKFVTISSSVTHIGDWAFGYCPGLESVTIPKGVTRIGKSTFTGCRRLRSVTIPSSVTSIGERAFSGCKGLKSVTIPSSVTRIGDWAFLWCSGLKSVTIPESVTHIGEEAFSGCKGLTSVTLPKGVKLGKSAFRGCPWQPTE